MHCKAGKKIVFVNMSWVYNSYILHTSMNFMLTYMYFFHKWFGINVYKQLRPPSTKSMYSIYIT